VEAIKLVIESTEKAIRYFLPGFVFAVLLPLSYPELVSELLKASDLTGYMLVAILFAGVVIYSLHRTVFEIADDLIFRAIFAIRKIDRKLIYEIFKGGSQKRDNLEGYFIYKYAIIHLSLIFSELGLLFSFKFHSTNSFLNRHLCFSQGFFGIALGISLITYIYYHNLKTTLYKVKYPEFDKAISKSSTGSRKEKPKDL